MDYEVLYAKMVEAAEQAIEAIEAADYGRARQLLIAAEQGCEEAYLQEAETDRPQKARPPAFRRAGLRFGRFTSAACCPQRPSGLR